MTEKTLPPEIVFRNALVSRSGDDWVPIAVKEDAEDDAKASAKGHRERLREHLKRLLANYNVIVLAGSGTSIDAVSPGVGGPKMPALWKTVAAWPEFKDIKKKISYTGTENIEDFLSQCHNSLAFVDAATVKVVKVFTKKAEKEIFESCTNFLKTAPSLPAHEELLGRIFF